MISPVVAGNQSENSATQALATAEVSRRSQPSGARAMEELLTGLVPGLPESLRRQILERAEGVPLYAVETVRMLLDRGLLAQEGNRYVVRGDIEELDVPETLHALVAALLGGGSIVLVSGGSQGVLESADLDRLAHQERARIA